MNTSNGNSAENNKLPLWDMIRMSYSNFFAHFSDVLQICWIWLVLAVPITAYANWLNLKQLIDIKPGARVPDVSLDVNLFNLLAGLLITLAALSIAVAWHRRVILDERPGFSGANIFSGSVWRYIGSGILITLAALAPVVPLLLIAFFVFGPPSAGASTLTNVLVPLLLFILYIVAMWIMLRLVLILPARAAGNTSSTLREIWDRSAGNCWRLFWGLLACSIPPMLIVYAAFFLFVGFPSTSDKASFDEFAWRLAIAHPFMMTYYLLVMPISIGFL